MTYATIDLRLPVFRIVIIADSRLSIIHVGYLMLSQSVLLYACDH